MQKLQGYKNRISRPTLFILLILFSTLILLIQNYHITLGNFTTSAESALGIFLLIIAIYASIRNLFYTKSSVYLYISVAFIALFTQFIINKLIEWNIGVNPSVELQMFHFETWTIVKLAFLIILCHGLVTTPKVLYKSDINKLIIGYSGPIITGIIGFNIFLLIYQDSSRLILKTNTYFSWILEVVIIFVYLALIIFYARNIVKNPAHLFISFSLILGFFSHVSYLANYEMDIINSWHVVLINLSYVSIIGTLAFPEKLLEKTEEYRFSIIRQVRLLVLIFLGLLIIYAGLIISLIVFTELRSPLFVSLGIDKSLILALMASCILISVAYSFFTAKNIINPIKILTSELRKFAQGDLSSKVKVVTNDEVGELGKIFNDMAAKLTVTYKNLEEKTLKLSQKIEEAEDTKKAMLNVLEDLRIERQELEETTAKDEAILKSIGQGVVVTDVNGKILIMNEVAGNLFEMNINNSIGKIWATDIPRITKETGELLTFHDTPISLAISSGKVVSNSDLVHYSHRSNQKLTLAITSAPVIMENNIIGAVVIYRDVSVEKQIDKAKTEFVSLASHQLRTPLSAINWFSEMLLSGDAGRINNKQKNYLQEIFNGNRRMIDLVNALLNVSRIDLGTLAIEPKDVDIVSVIESVLDELTIQIKDKKLKVEKSFDKKLPEMHVDPNLIRIVAQNILSNAVKYTPVNGNINIIINRIKNHILITIEDTGYGIPKKDQSKIFTKLFRADNVREQDTDGNGLGLYVTKYVVEQAANGKIWFKSKENKGTAFYIKLPIKGMKSKDGTRGLI